jgi:hypothetical protein
MALLIYSTKCKHSMDIFAYVDENPQLNQIVKLHNINQLGIPPQYANKITRVPTLLTQNGKMLVGNEVKQWLVSLLPAQEIMTCDVYGKCKGLTASLDGDDGEDFFDLGNYGQSLQPAMTPELQAKISRSVADAYDTIKD